MKITKDQIINILSNSNKPLKAKDIAKAIGGVDKTQINPILYAHPSVFFKNELHEWSCEKTDKISQQFNLHSGCDDHILEKDLLVRLKRIYGSKAEFKTGQKEAIIDLLKGQKTIVVQSTGWGKSLVFYLTTKILRDNKKGPAVIISPLCSLMEDQIKKNEVKKQNLQLEFINTSNKGLREISAAISWENNKPMEENEEKVKQILSLLSIDGAIKKGSDRKYIRTSLSWVYKADEIEQRKKQRLTELEEFNRFVASSQCYMQQVRLALCDQAAKRCDRCANRQGNHFFE